MAARNIMLSLAFIINDMPMLHNSIRGERTAIRIHIWYAFWILVTSVVIRVTSPAVLNLSMFAKENVCTLS